MNESCHTYEWVMSHIWMIHVTHMTWVMSHICMSQITHMQESSHDIVTCIILCHKLWMCHELWWHTMSRTMVIHYVTNYGCDTLMHESRHDMVTCIFSNLLYMHDGVISHMNESCCIWTSHVTYEWVMAHMNESCHIRMSHGTYEGVTSRHGHLHLLEPHLHTSMSHVAYEWVTSHMDESCHTQMSHVTICSPVSCRAPCTRMNESCHTWISHVTHINESCHTYE